jgi:hypothetical protein
MSCLLVKALIDRSAWRRYWLIDVNLSEKWTGCIFAQAQKCIFSPLIRLLFKAFFD